MREAPATGRVALAFATVYVVWGSTYLAIRLAVETLPPFAMAGVRFLTAGVLMFALVRLRDRAPLTLQNWLAAGSVGTLLLLGGNGLVCWAEQSVPSGVAALLIATVPLWMALLEWLAFRGERPTRLTAAGLLIGLAGIYLLIDPAQFRAGWTGLAGPAALLLACFFWSLGSLVSRRVAMPSSPWLATAMEMLVGGAVLLVVGAGLGEFGRFEPGAVSLRSLLALGYLAVFGSCLALTAYTWLLQVSTPARVATYAYVNPVIAVLLGAGLAHEPLTGRMMFGSAIIVAAVVLITRFGTSPRRVRPAAPATHNAGEAPAAPAAATRGDTAPRTVHAPAGPDAARFREAAAPGAAAEPGPQRIRAQLDGAPAPEKSAP